MKTDILSLFPEELKTMLTEYGLPSFRTAQISAWLKKGVFSFNEMNNLPKDIRNKLSETFSIYRPHPLLEQRSKTDGTIKYLWELEDGNAVETVIMSYSFGNTVCVSTQVGCRQGCAFCASTIGGLVRNLEPSEILNEVLCSEIYSQKNISNIVLMGIGEPLDNFDNVVKFLKLVNHPDVLNIGMRHITLSTCGLVERFDDLAELGFPITLSVSLHAPDDETRSMIMPVNRNRGIDALISSCLGYYKKTGRRVSFEYAMIDGVNDTAVHSKQLAKLAKIVGAHINLIPLNYVEERVFKPSTPGHMKAFIKILKDEGANVTVRRSLGSDVDASCGQLRRKSFRT